MPIEKVNAQWFHGARSIIAQWTGFDEIILADMFILEMGSHCDLPLKATITNRTMIRKCFCVRCKMFSKMILAKESLLAHTAFIPNQIQRCKTVKRRDQIAVMPIQINKLYIRFNSGVSHFMPSHIGSIGKFHVAHITFKALPCHCTIVTVRVWLELQTTKSVKGKTNI